MHPEDPIINAVVVLKSAPTCAEVLAAIQPLFYYERCDAQAVARRWSMAVCVSLSATA